MQADTSIYGKGRLLRRLMQAAPAAPAVASMAAGGNNAASIQNVAGQDEPKYDVRFSFYVTLSLITDESAV